MALDPRISLGVRGIELQDPLAQYGKVMALQNAQQQNALAQMQMRQAEREQAAQNALNTAYSQAYGSDGEFDINRLRTNLAGSGYGAKIPEAEKRYFEGRESQTKASKAHVDLVDAKLKQSREFLSGIDPNSPNAANEVAQWVQGNFQDPVLGRELRARGVTLEQALNRIEQFANKPGGIAALLDESKLSVEKFMEMNKPTTHVIDQSGQRQVIQIPGRGGKPTTVGVYADVPLPADVEAQKSKIARAGATSVNVSTDKAYGSAIGKLAAEEDIALHQKAQAIPIEIKKVDETLNVLRNSDINTGIGAEVFTVLDQAKAQFIDDKKAGKRVTDTQYLDSLLGSSVFPQISALGIGAKGIDTPAEREFLRKVITGTIGLNKDTLIKMTELRRRGLQDAVNVYNNKVKSGELDRFFEGTGRSRALIELPDAPTNKKSTPAAKPPSGIDPALWNVMTPQEQELWQK